MPDALPVIHADAVDAFIARWEKSGGAEQANFQSFIGEMCDLLRLPRPDVAHGGSGSYRFEMQVWQAHEDGEGKRLGRIDLYHRGHFIMEAKQGHREERQRRLFSAETEAERRAHIRNSIGWQRYMQAAKGQAEGYARRLPAGDPYPPFLIVCDVGFCFDLWADFSGTGRHYAQFPDREGFRVYLTDLRKPVVRDLLRTLWHDPASLNPSLKRVEVTRQIALLLARMVRELEGPKNSRRHTPASVSDFLIRCIFCMFAQSVELLPPGAFTRLLQSAKRDPAGFAPMLLELWRAMDTGGYSTTLHSVVRRFNGGMFAACPPPPLVDADMIGLLLQAAAKDWSFVEPAIFGSLLEGALDEPERAALGAHFTPRVFVERLVLPTVMEPLRVDWDGAKAAAEDQLRKGNSEAAIATIRAFHGKLCTIKVLDPACGSGNFLYVTFELMKRLEGEVLDALENLSPGEGDRLNVGGASVDPHQFLGLEKNARAVPVAELVLWIGYLQWHFRTHGKAAPEEPILHDFKNIQHADALLTYDREDPMRGADGAPRTRHGGRMVRHPITGEEIPDPTDRVLMLRPVAPVAAEWPEADFIVGNPPFIAGKDMRQELGDGYPEELWATYPEVPGAADICMHFWWKAAQAMTALHKDRRPVRRFGFITTNSLDQVFARRVLTTTMEARQPLRLVFAIPDHPWSKARGAASVRIAMTVAELATVDAIPARLLRLTAEHATESDAPDVEFSETIGRINADLTIGTDATAARPLRANGRLCSPGVKLHGAGFIVTPHEAAGLGLGRVEGLKRHIRPYSNGRDLTGRSRGVMVIDLFGLTEDVTRRDYPKVFQRLLLRVKAERDAKALAGPDAAGYARLWWLHGKPRPELRTALRGLPRYIATVETAKHRIFTFLPAEVIPDNMLVCIATSSAFHLGVLQSRLHVQWALAAGGVLENRPRYNKTVCFDPFPFPDATAAQMAEIGALAEELDAHRKTVMASHRHLTLTRLYNVLEAVRAGRPLTRTEQDIHEAGGVSILRLLHDQLDAAVGASYGWPADLPAAEIVARVVALNATRRAEEAAGEVRWLRAVYQDPEGTRRQATQTALDVRAKAINIILPWPKDPAAQYVSLRTALTSGPATAADLVRRFDGAPKSSRLRDMLRTLSALGQAREIGTHYSA